jgi:hypothetical protein
MTSAGGFRPFSMFPVSPAAPRDLMHVDGARIQASSAHPSSLKFIS